MNETVRLKLSVIVLVLLSMGVIGLVAKLTELNCAMTRIALGY